MPHNDPSTNINQKLSQLFDGQLSQSEFEELEQSLLENPEARQTYFNYVDINTGINQHTVERLKELDCIVTANAPQPNPVSKKTTSEKKQKHSSLLAYCAVAAASVALILFVEVFIMKRFFWEQSLPEKVTSNENDFSSTYVATLVRSTDCQWGNDNRPLFSGQRLLSKDLFLIEGIAEFRFDSGIRLVLEGPTQLKIKSVNCAEMISGSVVLHGYESAPEFELITSQAKFFDVGTEYGIKVTEDQGTELHVFEGAVRIQPIDNSSGENSKVQIVNQGIAQYFDNQTSKKIALEPGKFQRNVPKKDIHQTDSREALIAYDGFQVRKKSDQNPFQEWQQTGTGWEGPWRNWRLGLQNKEKDATHVLKLSPATNYPQKTIFPDLQSSDQSGCIQFKKSNQSWRTLKNPLRLDTDVVYYFSLFFEKSTPYSKKITQNQYGNISFRTLDDPNNQKIKTKNILFGISSDNNTTLQTPFETVRKAPPISYNKPYLFIGKIVASKNSPDQVFLRVFSQSEKIPAEEPLIWTCISAPYDDASIYDQVRFQVGKYSSFFFDELRIGTTWESVTNFQPPKENLK